MLLVLIPIVWLTAVALVMAVCRASSPRSGVPAVTEEGEPYRVCDGLIVWEQPSASVLRCARRLAQPELPARLVRTRSRIPRRRRVVVHGAR
jgi:hypothetical protein